MNNISPRAHSLPVTAALAAAFLSTAAFNHAAEIPEGIVSIRRDLSPVVNLDVKMRVDAQHDISLRLEPSQEPLGQQLDTHQMWKLDQIRAEIPERFRLLQRLFPRQIAEYLLRQGKATPAAPAGAEREGAVPVAMRLAERYLTEPQPAGFTEEQMQARREFVVNAAAQLPAEDAALRAVLESCARDVDADFGSVKKAAAFRALRKQYSPYQAVPLSVAGDTLMIGGKIITDRLRTDASIAGRTVDQFAQEKYAALMRELADWRAGQISGDAYAGTIKSFLNDPRLAGFTPEEIHRAYLRIFGRELKTDLRADRVSAKEGRAVTYAELADGGR